MVASYLSLSSLPGHSLAHASRQVKLVERKFDGGASFRDNAPSAAAAAAGAAAPPPPPPADASCTWTKRKGRRKDFGKNKEALSDSLRFRNMCNCGEGGAGRKYLQCSGLNNVSGILALNLLQKGRQAVCARADGLKDLLNLGLRGRLGAGKVCEHVGGHVLHLFHRKAGAGFVT